MYFLIAAVIAQFFNPIAELFIAIGIPTKKAKAEIETLQVNVEPKIRTFNTSIYEHSEIKVFKNIKFLGEISSNWPDDLLGTNVYKTLEACW